MSSEKFATGKVSGVKILLQLITSEMAVMQALSIVNCLIESHLLPFQVKVKIIFGEPS